MKTKLPLQFKVCGDQHNLMLKFEIDWQVAKNG